MKTILHNRNIKNPLKLVTVEEFFKESGKEYLAFDLGDGLEMLNVDQLKQKIDNNITVNPSITKIPKKIEPEIRAIEELKRIPKILGYCKVGECVECDTHREIIRRRIIFLQNKLNKE